MDRIAASALGGSPVRSQSRTKSPVGLKGNPAFTFDGPLLFRLPVLVTGRRGHRPRLPIPCLLSRADRTCVSGEPTSANDPELTSAFILQCEQFDQWVGLRRGMVGP